MNPLAEFVRHLRVESPRLGAKAWDARSEARFAPQRGRGRPFFDDSDRFAIAALHALLAEGNPLGMRADAVREHDAARIAAALFAPRRGVGVDWEVYEVDGRHRLMPTIRGAGTEAERDKALFDRARILLRKYRSISGDERRWTELSAELLISARRTRSDRAFWFYCDMLVDLGFGTVPKPIVMELMKIRATIVHFQRFSGI